VPLGRVSGVIPHKLFIFDKIPKIAAKKQPNACPVKLSTPCRTQLYKFGILSTLCHYLSANFPAKIIRIFSGASH